MKNFKRNGFTLIELIAVLVIMAILALIVTPLVMNIIRKARIAADKRSIDAYGRSIELAITGYLLDNGKFPTSVDQLTIEYSGKEVDCKTKLINSDGSIYLSGCSVKNIEVLDSNNIDGYYHYGKNKDNNEQQNSNINVPIEKKVIIGNKATASSESVNVVGTFWLTNIDQMTELSGKKLYSITLNAVNQGIITIRGFNGVIDKNESDDYFLSSSQTAGSNAIDLFTISLESGEQTYLLDGTDNRVNILEPSLLNNCPSTIGIFKNGDSAKFYFNGELADNGIRQFVCSSSGNCGRNASLTMDISYFNSNEEYEQYKNYKNRLISVLNGKNFSILADSISTYTGYSNNTDSNSTIGTNKIYYTGSNSGISDVSQTWWMKLVNQMSMNLLVNNSSSGSKVIGSGNASGSTIDQGYGIRSENLHDDNGSNAGTTPDIIAIYLGINDFDGNVSLGNYNENLYNSLIHNNGDETYNYNEPTNFIEAYIIMVHKVITKYKNADVFCFTLLPNGVRTDYDALEQYNEAIKRIADHYNIDVVDLYNSSGITSSNYLKYSNELNGLHPNQTGMTAITNAVIRKFMNKYLS